MNRTIIYLILIFICMMSCNHYSIDNKAEYYLHVEYWGHRDIDYTITLPIGNRDDHKVTTSLPFDTSFVAQSNGNIGYIKMKSNTDSIGCDVKINLIRMPSDTLLDVKRRSIIKCAEDFYF